MLRPLAAMRSRASAGYAPAPDATHARRMARAAPFPTTFDSDTHVPLMGSHADQAGQCILGEISCEAAALLGCSVRFLKGTLMRRGPRKTPSTDAPFLLSSWGYRSAPG